MIPKNNPKIKNTQPFLPFSRAIKKLAKAQTTPIKGYIKNNVSIFVFKKNELVGIVSSSKALRNSMIVRCSVSVQSALTDVYRFS